VSNISGGRRISTGGTKANIALSSLCQNNMAVPSAGENLNIVMVICGCLTLNIIDGFVDPRRISSMIANMTQAAQGTLFE
jgi:hypothetical protein